MPRIEDAGGEGDDRPPDLSAPLDGVDAPDGPAGAGRGEPLRRRLRHVAQRPAGRADGEPPGEPGLVRGPQLEVVEPRVLAGGGEEGEATRFALRLVERGGKPRGDPSLLLGRALPHQLDHLAPGRDRLGHRRLEPDLHASLEEAGRRQDEEGDGEKGEADVRQDDPDAELRAEDPAPGFEDEPRRAPSDDEEQREDEEDDDVEEDEQEDPVRRGRRRERPGPEDERVDPGEGEAE